MVELVRLSLIDDSNRGDHAHLTSDDNCLYLYEYTSQRDYSFSDTNQIIKNLKKKPSQSGQGHYVDKGRAIAHCARELGAALNPNWLEITTLVPVPGSKAPGHPDYDDRMAQICQKLRNPPPDVRLLVKQSGSTNASHEVGAGVRVSIDELLALYVIDETLTQPAPRAIGIVDDVLTAGTHYRAMHSVLSARFPGIPIVGLFIARRVFPDVSGEFEGVIGF